MTVQTIRLYDLRRRPQKDAAVFFGGIFRKSVPPADTGIKRAETVQDDGEKDKRKSCLKGGSFLGVFRIGRKRPRCILRERKPQRSRFMNQFGRI